MTDDASTTEPKKLEIDAAWVYTRTAGDSSGNLPFVELYYGAGKAVEVHLTASLSYDRGQTGNTAFGASDTEIAIKYRFVEESPDGLRPAIAFEPALGFPTGDFQHNFGTGHAHLFLPIWGEKKIGSWDSWGGGGYEINPGSGNRNYWLIGAGLGRDVSETLWVGLEIYHQSPDHDRRPPTTAFNVGASYKLGSGAVLLLTLGRGLENADKTNQFTSYVGCRFSF